MGAQPALRADAKRNYDAIVKAAAAEFARSGSDASLEEIARQAGVGSATLHRRFPTRRALVQAVFAEQIAALCAAAPIPDASGSAASALRAWLSDVAEFSAEARGLAQTIMFDEDQPAPGSCEAALIVTTTALLQSAQAAGEVTGDVSAIDLLALVNGISITAQARPNPSATARSLSNLIFDGVQR